mgnify:CR=1 FL=1
MRVKRLGFEIPFAERQIFIQGVFTSETECYR